MTIEACLDDLDQRKLYFYEQLEPTTTALFRILLAPGDVVIDVGANIGYYSLLASARVRAKGVVLSIEPEPIIVARLRHNLGLNNVTNTQVFEGAAGDEMGDLALYHGIASGQTTRVEPSPSELRTPILVPQSTLDQLAADYSLRAVRLIKVDVEGGEYHVLRGAIGILSDIQPELLVEVTPKFLEGAHASVMQLFDLMNSAGYAGYEVQEHERRLVPVDALRVSSGRNVLFSTKGGEYVDSLNRSLAQAQPDSTARFAN